MQNALPPLVDPAPEATARARRRLVQAALAGPLLPAGHAVWAQPAPGRVVQLRGDVLRNGQPLLPQGSVAAGDRVETGPGSSAVFTVGDSAYLVRENTRLELQGEAPGAVRVLRLLTGAVASVWRRGTDRQVLTPTMTAGIRGTGVYAEVFPEEDWRSYFCNCYGTVELTAGSERVLSESRYHQSFWAEASPRQGRSLRPAAAINHSDEEMEMLAALVQERTAWQISGIKGPKDGRGRLYEQPPAPADAPYPGHGSVH